MEDKYTKIAEEILRLVSAHNSNQMLFKLPFTDMIKIIASTIECNLSQEEPRLRTFHKTVTEYVSALEITPEMDCTHSMEELKNMVTKLNKQYLNPEIKNG